MRTEMATRHDLSWCTSKQLGALHQLRKLWGRDRIHIIGKELAGTALMVRAEYQNGSSMIIGIEPDGYVHS